MKRIERIILSPEAAMISGIGAILLWLLLAVQS